MSYFSDLDLRLRALGIDPDRAQKPLCGDCGQPQMILGLEQGRLVWACRAPACVELKRARRAARIAPPTSTLALPWPQLAVYSLITAHCDGCDDSCEHAMVELPDGEIVFVCCECLTQTSLREESREPVTAV
jgi:hypothetical protein